MTGTSVRADDPTFELDIPAGTADVALKALAEQTEFLTLFQSNDVERVRTPGIKGPFTVEEALARILADTPLAFDLIKRGVIVVRYSNPSASIRPEETLTESETMQDKQSFFRRATAFLAAAVLAPATGAAEAQAADQAADEEVIEEIVVTGIRGSLQQSLERKRNADHFVDAITAEDIGAFPDQNLAEALQRISGVAIDRKSGEGAFVSVRGLGPQFVMATVHGRVSASNVAPGDFDGVGNSNPKSRAVGFHAFQSGLVQAVEVHKSPRADHVEGGLGGFVDVQPRRPLELGERHAAFSFDSTINELADDTAPGAFAMYSDVLTDNLGFMVSAQWDNRVFRTDQLRGWSHVFRTVNVDGVQVGSGYYPQQLNAELHTTDRDRLNVSSSLQWQPSDDLDITFDLLYANNKTNEADYWRDYRIRQGNGRITEAEFIQDNGETIFTKISTTAGLFLSNQVEEVEAENVNLGVNVKFQATDNLAINVDASVSDTEAPIFLEGALMRHTRTQMTWEKYGSGRLPSMTSTDPITDPAWYHVVWSSRAGHLVDDRNSQFRVDVTYEHDGDWLQTVQVGARTYRQDRRDRSRYMGTTTWRGDPITAHGGGVAHPAEGDFLSGLGMDFPANTPAPNRDFLINELSNVSHEQLMPWQGHTAESQANFPDFSLPFNEDLNHDDDGNAIYAMVTFAGGLGDTPYTGNIGVRYVDNSTGSIGEISRPIHIDYSDPTAPNIITSAPEFLEISHDYTEILPALNLRFDPTDEIVVRVAAAKVMTRPRFLDLSPRQTVQARNRTTRGGNGTLDPTTAVQFDLAVEWYFDDYSIASVGLFAKNIEGFVQQEQTPTPWPGIIDPETNQPLVLIAFRPLNTGDSDLTGIELAFQRTFTDLLPAPWDGLGIVTNYTRINSGSDFENELTGAAYGIPGLSEDTINFTLFYEKGPWSGRVSYNYRDDFLDAIADGQGHPRFVDAYDQWDVSFGYAVNDNVSVMLEGINLTDEIVYYYNALGTSTMEHIVGATHAGRRFQAGVRWRL
ncbi:MAG: TonB-dependent receptor [Gammaproteobacteria bacterium]|nr:TonB-dependent receptor [Gammaproteobacteria bacterium]